MTSAFLSKHVFLKEKQPSYYRSFKMLTQDYSKTKAKPLQDYLFMHFQKKKKKNVRNLQLFNKVSTEL